MASPEPLEQILWQQKISCKLAPTILYLFQLEGQVNVVSLWLPFCAKKSTSKEQMLQNHVLAANL
jgi:hypothetical protein